MKLKMSLSKLIEKWIVEETRAYSASLPATSVHIDEISKEFEDSDAWVDGASQCFLIACELRDKLYPEYAIGLVIHLRVDQRPIGVNFQSLDELSGELNSWTPPELVLMTPEQCSKYVSVIKKGIKTDFLEAGVPDAMCYHDEDVDYQCGAPEYVRSVRFVSQGRSRKDA